MRPRHHRRHARSSDAGHRVRPREPVPRNPGPTRTGGARTSGRPSDSRAPTEPETGGPTGRIRHPSLDSNAQRSELAITEPVHEDRPLRSSELKVRPGGWGCWSRAAPTAPQPSSATSTHSWPSGKTLGALAPGQVADVTRVQCGLSMILSRLWCCLTPFGRALLSRLGTAFMIFRSMILTNPARRRPTRPCRRRAGLGAPTPEYRTRAGSGLARSRQPTRTGTSDTRWSYRGARWDPGHPQRRDPARPGRVSRFSADGAGTSTERPCRSYSGVRE